jgi:hypothetical protein
VKHKALVFPIENGIAENIGRKQIARKLDALKGERERARECLGESRLTHARNVFNQEVAACEQTSDCELYRLILSHNNFTNLLCEGVNVIRHSEMICGNDTVRKQGYPEIDSINLTGRQFATQFPNLLLAFVGARAQEVGDAHFCSQGNGFGRKTCPSCAGNSKEIGGARR